MCEELLHLKQENKEKKKDKIMSLTNSSMDLI